MTHGGSGGGTYEYSVEQLRSLVRRWQRLADDYADDIQAARPLIGVQAPGADFVSEHYAMRANESGQAFINALVEHQKFCQEQADKCRAALAGHPAAGQRALSPTR
ncbi:MAG: PE domain-containing protein [Pseudonocardiaceae bacterium]|nr:PE domain-containing protein [Pseudonocardiaceae bacterium]